MMRWRSVGVEPRGSREANDDARANQIASTPGERCSLMQLLDNASSLEESKDYFRWKFLVVADCKTSFHQMNKISSVATYLG